MTTQRQGEETFATVVATMLLGVVVGSYVYGGLFGDGPHRDTLHEAGTLLPVEAIEIVEAEPSKAPGGIARFWARALLTHPYPQTRLQAAVELRSAADPTALAALSRALGSDTDVRVRAESAHALGELSGATMLGELMKAALTDESPRVREAAVVALGRTGSDLAVVPLSQILGNDRSETVRAAAAGSLAVLGLESGLRALRHAAENDASAALPRRALRAVAEPRKR